MKFLFLCVACVVLFTASASASYNPNYKPHTVTKRVLCSSLKFRPQRCSFPGEVISLRLVHRVSHSHCTLGHSYFRGTASIIVLKGCRAWFDVTYELLPPKELPATKYHLVHCASHGFKLNRCPLPAEVKSLILVKRVSHSPCHLGRSFYKGHKAIIVDHGCRGDFLVGVTVRH